MPRDWAIPPGYHRIAFRAMDCDVVILLPASSGAAGHTAEALFRLWERTLSRFDPASELARLNAGAGRPVPVGPLLRDVVRSALVWARRTGGLFDPTLGAELAALGYDRPFSQLGHEPAPTVNAPHRRGTWRDVRVGPLGTITLPARVALDLGGIAKGMAVDAAIAELRDAGVESALVSAGGDLAVTGALLGSGAWPVTVVDRTGPVTVPLLRGALATSSVERRRWPAAEGMRHHILDPRTRRPAGTPLRRVTVAAPTCAAAEVHAKAAVILGREDGRRWLEDAGCTALLVEEAASHTVGHWPGHGAAVA